jgi:pilus assembly protein Flp/PilA
MLRSLFFRRFRDDRGATMVEYALMLALIALVCVIAVTLVGSGANGLFTKNGNAIVNAL